VVIVAVALIASVLVVAMGVQQGDARQVDHQADHRDRQRPGVVDRVRRGQPGDRLADRRHRHQGEGDRAGEAGQGPDLAGAKGQGVVIGVAAGGRVGEGGQAQGGDVGRHVPAVGEERHRAGRVADHDLDHHGRRGQPDDQAQAALLALGRDRPADRARGGEGPGVHGDHPTKRRRTWASSAAAAARAGRDSPGAAT
jgi:hypothetical protein